VLQYDVIHDVFLCTHIAVYSDIVQMLVQGSGGCMHNIAMISQR
jgi:hypothetical protein